MKEIRTITVPEGTITYELQRKKMWHLRLRMDARGCVIASVPYPCTGEQADEFVRGHSQWVFQALARYEQQSRQPLLPERSDAEADAMLRCALEKVYPLIKPLGVGMPVLKVRKMRSQWGNCHWRQGYITLNRALHRCPPELREYVALHELVHFIHPNHGRGFYAVMDRLMPEWKHYREQLDRHAALLRPEE